MSSQSNGSILSDQERKDLAAALKRTARSDRRRLHRLRRATGIPSYRWYPPFRQTIMFLAGLRCRVHVIHPECIPGGLDYYYQPYQRQPQARISDFGFVLAPTHRTAWDIVAVGLPKRGMTWVCKAPFAMFFWAWLCQIEGALPVFRYGKDDSPKINPVLRYAFRRWTFHGLPEIKQRVLIALQIGVPAVVFPEGTRKSTAVKSTANKYGAAMFARLSGVPLIPAAIVGGSSKNGDPERFIHYRTGRVLQREPTGLDQLRYRRLIVITYGEPIRIASEAEGGDAETMRRWESTINEALHCEGCAYLEAL